MAYPLSIDSFPTHTNGEIIDASYDNSQQTAIVSTQTKVGITGSVDPSSLDYQVTNSASSNPGHKHTFSSLSDFTITSPVANQVLKYDGSKWVNGSGLKFGGDGSDGALSINSGTTTIDLGSAQFVVKNYTAISITSSGKLAFSNPHANGTTIILRSQGNVDLTSATDPLIDIESLGGTGGIGSTQGGGVGLGGDGGRGAGALLIECGGALNGTGIINARGKVGTDATAGTGQNTGGRGGGGGTVCILYGTLTTNSLTIRTTVGGNGSDTAGGTAGGVVGGNGTPGKGVITATREGQGAGASAPTTTIVLPNFVSTASFPVIARTYLTPGAGGGGGATATNATPTVGYGIQGVAGAGYSLVAQNTYYA